MQKASSHPNKLELLPLVSAWFQVLLTPLFGVLFTFPSQYWFAIGLSGVFSLTGWCRQIQTGRLRPRPTQGTAIPRYLTHTGLSPSMVQFSKSFCFNIMFMCGPTTPLHKCKGLGCSAFARHYLRNHLIVFFSSGYLDVSVLRVSFPLTWDSRSSIWRVPPFGNLRIKASLQLPTAYRSLPRPSSTPRAKASTMRPYSLPIL